MSIGTVYLREGKWSEAIPQFTKALTSLQTRLHIPTSAQLTSS